MKKKRIKRLCTAAVIVGTTAASITAPVYALDDMLGEGIYIENVEADIPADVETEVMADIETDIPTDAGTDVVSEQTDNEALTDEAQEDPEIPAEEPSADDDQIFAGAQIDQNTETESAENEQTESEAEVIIPSRDDLFPDGEIPRPDWLTEEEYVRLVWERTSEEYRADLNAIEARLDLSGQALIDATKSKDETAIASALERYRADVIDFFWIVKYILPSYTEPPVKEELPEAAEAEIKQPEITEAEVKIPEIAAVQEQVVQMPAMINYEMTDLVVEAPEVKVKRATYLSHLRRLTKREWIIRHYMRRLSSRLRR